MRKLLSANLSRLRINKAFWLTVILMILVESFLGWLVLRQNSTRIDIVLFISLQGIGVLISVFFSLFLGTEYSDGTIRNKLIVGHKRSSVYLASFITGVISVTIIYFAWIFTGGIFGIIYHASLNNNIGKIALIGVAYWLACVSYISIFNLVGMISSSKARTSIICILTAFILIFGGLTCYSLARPGFLSSSQRVIFQFLFDLNPFGQTFQIMSIDVALLWKLVAYSLLLSSILTALGMYSFSKKDLK